MAPSFARTVGDTTSEAEKEVSTVFVHLKKLLCVKNRLCSPLLRLPTEIIIHIVSFVMGDMQFQNVWWPIFTTCRRIHRIMCSATTLWWRVDTLPGRGAGVVLMGSNGDPRAAVVRLSPSEPEDGDNILDRWGHRWVLQSHRLHTLEVFGSPSGLPHFSWIFERALPCLEHLTFHMVSDYNDDIMIHPVALQFPIGVPLRVLDLRNTTLPWSSDAFAGLIELCLDFRDVVVSIAEDELLGIFDASPQLEHLSLVEVRQIIPTKNSQQQLPSKHIVPLPALTFLRLKDKPETVGYILAHLDTPALASLEIHSDISNRDAAESLGHFLPGKHLPKRLFSDPPVFAIVSYRSTFLRFSIGGLEAYFDLFAGEAAAVATAFFPFVPPSITTLKVEFSELGVQGWKEFFISHPEVQLIEYTEFRRGPIFESFWDALSPSEDGGQVLLCPRLESIALWVFATTTRLKPAIRCLLRRGSAGLKLRHFKIAEFNWHPWAYRVVGRIRPFVETLEVASPDELTQKVTPVSMMDRARTDRFQVGEPFLLSTR